MGGPEQKPDLERLAARELDTLLQNKAIGTSLAIGMTSKLSLILERFIPQLLRREHPEWENESIDGLIFSHAVKRAEAGAQLAGACILISDQTVTPFNFDLHIAADDRLRPIWIRLGERGDGPLGISGPACNSRSANELLAGLDARLGRIEWVYEVFLE